MKDNLLLYTLNIPKKVYKCFGETGHFMHLRSGTGSVIYLMALCIICWLIFYCVLLFQSISFFFI